MENLIGETIDTAIRRDFSESRSIFYDLMIFGLFLVVLGCCVFVTDRIYEYKYQLWTADIEQDLMTLKQDSAASIEAMNTKLVRIAELILTGPKSLKPDIAIYAGGVFFGLLLGGLSLVIAYNRPSSFVVLTEKAKTRKSKIKKSEKRSVLGLFWGYIAAISSSVIAGFVYAYLT